MAARYWVLACVGKRPEARGLNVLVAKPPQHLMMMWHGRADVIATYKICTVRAGDSSSSSREGVEAGHRPTRALLPTDEAECEAQPAAQPGYSGTLRCVQTMIGNKLPLIGVQ